MTPKGWNSWSRSGWITETMKRNYNYTLYVTKLQLASIFMNRNRKIHLGWWITERMERNPSLKCIIERSTLWITKKSNLRNLVTNIPNVNDFRRLCHFKLSWKKKKKFELIHGKRFLIQYMKQSILKSKRKNGWWLLIKQSKRIWK